VGSAEPGLKHGPGGLLCGTFALAEPGADGGGTVGDGEGRQGDAVLEGEGVVDLGADGVTWVTGAEEKVGHGGAARGRELDAGAAHIGVGVVGHEVQDEGGSGARLVGAVVAFFEEAGQAANRGGADGGDLVLEAGGERSLVGICDVLVELALLGEGLDNGARGAARTEPDALVCKGKEVRCVVWT
jgi:hypothetical protein